MLTQKKGRRGSKSRIGDAAKVVSFDILAANLQQLHIYNIPLDAIARDHHLNVRYLLNLVKHGRGSCTSLPSVSFAREPSWGLSNFFPFTRGRPFGSFFAKLAETPLAISRTLYFNQ